uniref:Uncharacterized protein n=1 Tax=Picea glauca TaxID=3330 RepID=A0A101LZM4_PICGL|nr:hypothetical protein ABT39_MTgene5319 [Picea glauca]QHR88896.1 hypothetical protein Q903MT_gene2915 [Picea sitchensis]
MQVVVLLQLLMEMLFVQLIREILQFMLVILV